MATKFARYGPEDRYGPPPGAGFCLSVFAVLRKGDKVLLGVARPGPRWLRDWIPAWKTYSKEDLAVAYDTPRLPSTYLQEGEDPEACLGRILRDQLGMRGAEARGPQVFSYTAPSDWYPGHKHWDLAFAYEVRGALPKRAPKEWRSLRWYGPEDLRGVDFGWNHDFMEDLGFVTGPAGARGGSTPRRPPRRPAAARPRATPRRRR